MPELDFGDHSETFQVENVELFHLFPAWLMGRWPERGQGSWMHL
jgi:hypothetical protein